jgi:hypothetical protein
VVVGGRIVVAFCDVYRGGAYDAQRVFQGRCLTDCELAAPLEKILPRLVLFGHFGRRGGGGHLA